MKRANITKITFRLDRIAYNDLTTIKHYLRYYTKSKTSLNFVLNQLVKVRLNALHLSIKQKQHLNYIGSKQFIKDRQKVVPAITVLVRACNQFTRQIYGDAHNLNSLTKLCLANKNNMDYQLFITIQSQLTSYNSTITKSLEYSRQLEKGVSKLWQEI